MSTSASRMLRAGSTAPTTENTSGSQYAANSTVVSAQACTLSRALPPRKRAISRRPMAISAPSTITPSA